MKKDDRCSFDFSRTLLALRCHDRDGFGGNQSHSLPFFLQQEHRDGFGDDVSHTSLSVVAACSLSASDGHRDVFGDDGLHTVSLLSWQPVHCLLRDETGAA